MKNYYSILGVLETADSSEIKKAYRNLMKKWHPDRCQHVDASRRTEEVSLAYSVLSCPVSRHKHDVQLREAGLSSKPLFIKTEIPCLDCECKGFRKEYKKSIINSIKLALGLIVSHEERTCLTCCGTGWERRIQEY